MPSISFSNPRTIQKWNKPFDTFNLIVKLTSLTCNREAVILWLVSAAWLSIPYYYSHMEQADYGM
jgi:hypothetical protein